MQSPLRYAVPLFWETGIQKIGGPWKWVINSLTAHALHDVMMWNTDNKCLLIIAGELNMMAFKDPFQLRWFYEKENKTKQKPESK